MVASPNFNFLHGGNMLILAFDPPRFQPGRYLCAEINSAAVQEAISTEPQEHQRADAGYRIQHGDDSPPLWNGMLAPGDIVLLSGRYGWFQIAYYAIEEG